MPSSQRSRDFLLPQGQPESKHVIFGVVLKEKRGFDVKQPVFNGRSVAIVAMAT